MCDARHCDNLPIHLRERVVQILGENCVTDEGQPYADVQRPSYEWRRKASEPVRAEDSKQKIKIKINIYRKYFEPKAY